MSSEAPDLATLTLQQHGVEVTAATWLRTYFDLKELDFDDAEAQADALDACPEHLTEEARELLKDTAALIEATNP